MKALSASRMRAAAAAAQARVPRADLRDPGVPRPRPHPARGQRLHGRARGGALPSQAGRTRQSRRARLSRAVVTRVDADETIEQFKPVAYGRATEVLPGATLTFHDAGHILGSASVWLQLEEEGARSRIVFSGDVGQYDSPILRDPEGNGTADVVVMESTYGNRRHRERSETLVNSARSCARRGPAAATCSSPRSRWDAARKSSTSSPGTSTSGASATGMCSWTVRWPSRHPRSTGSIPSCTTRKRAQRAGMPAACRRCRTSSSAALPKNQWRSTCCGVARSSSRGAGCAAAGASCITSSTTSRSGSAT